MDIEHNRTFFNDMASKWDTITNHDPTKINYLLNKLNLNSSDSVVDVGSGTGILIPHLLNVCTNGKITAIDIAENMIEQAKSKYENCDINFVIGDVTDYPFKENSFDAVICYSVFPHFVNQQHTIRAIKNILKPGGKLLVCHSESRETINNRHKNLKRNLISNPLQPATSVKELFVNSNLNVLDYEDTDSHYYILGQK